MVGKIIELAQKHKTQKVDYLYMLNGYEKHLPKECENFLEIGCLFLGSTKMFRDYYDGKAKIHALDLFHPDYTASVDDARHEGFIAYQGSQTDMELLSTLPVMDVIVEDGSHHSDDQIITFKYLFDNKLKSGGLYVLEDLHCCTEPYWWCSCQGFENTMLATLQRMEQGGSMFGQFFDYEEAKKYSEMIDKFDLINNSIAFIWKK